MDGCIPSWKDIRLNEKNAEVAFAAMQLPAEVYSCSAGLVAVIRRGAEVAKCFLPPQVIIYIIVSAACGGLSWPNCVQK